MSIGLDCHVQLLYELTALLGFFIMPVISSDSLYLCTLKCSFAAHQLLLKGRRRVVVQRKCNAIPKYLIFPTNQGY